MVTEMWVCSETAEVRGLFHHHRVTLDGVPIAGYIDNSTGQRIIVKESEALDRMIASGAKYAMVTIGAIELAGRKGRVITISDFVLLDRLDSAGEMACNIY